METTRMSRHRREQYRAVINSRPRITKRKAFNRFNRVVPPPR